MLSPAPTEPATPTGSRSVTPAAAPPPGPVDDAIDPLDLLLVLGRHRRMLVLWPLAAALLAAAVSLALPETFTGTTRLLPPQQQQSVASAMLSQLGGLAGAAGSALGVKSPSDLYVGMLKSWAVSDPIIERFHLKEAYGAKTLVDARKELSDRTRLDADKSGIITVEVDARDPKLAADLANAYVEELYRLTQTLAVTDAAQRRLFLERQLAQAKEKLADAEVALRTAMESGGVVSVDAQSRTAVETGARLRAQLSAKEIQLSAMRAYATESHPEVRRAEQELAAMRGELARLESGGAASTRSAGAAPGPAGPKGIETLRLVREVKFQEVLFELLTKQFELARVEESKDAPLVQVVDRAQPPDKRSKPKRSIMVLLAFAGGLAAAVLAALARDAAAQALADPARRAKLAALGRAWRGRE